MLTLANFLNWLWPQTQKHLYDPYELVVTELRPSGPSFANYPLVGPAGFPTAGSPLVGDIVDTYLNACAMRRDRKSPRGTEVDAGLIPALWIDIDRQKSDSVEPYPVDDEEIFQILDAVQQPTFIVDTGRGYHAWWLLKDGPQVLNQETRGTWRRRSRAWQQLLKDKAKKLGRTLDSTHDLARMLRLPDARRLLNGEPFQVTILPQQGPLLWEETLRSLDGGASEPVAEKSSSAPIDVLGVLSRQRLGAELDDAVRRAAKGLPVSPVGTRDRTLTRLASVVAARMPEVTPEVFAQSLAASLASHEQDDDGTYTQEDRLAWAAQKLDRQRDRHEERKERRHQEAVGFVAEVQAEAETVDLAKRDAEVEAPTLVEVTRASINVVERYLPTGIPELDALLGGGLLEKACHVVCAPPGAGKTSLAVTLALQLAREVPTTICFSELPPEEMANRLVAANSGHTLAAVSGRQVDAQALARAASEGRRSLRLADLRRSTDPGADLGRLLAQARSEHPERRAALIVDYLQDLVDDDDRGSKDRTRTSVTRIARQLRELSENTGCPVLAVSSVSRDWYRSAGQQQAQDEERVQFYGAERFLAAAKESGDVEYAAATVWYLQSDTSDEHEVGVAALHVAKSRRGRTGSVGLAWDRAIGRFRPDPGAPRRLGQNLDLGRQELRERLLEALGQAGDGKPTTRWLARSLGRRGQDVAEVLQDLEAEGSVTRPDGKRGGWRIFSHGE